MTRAAAWLILLAAAGPAGAAGDPGAALAALGGWRMGDTVAVTRSVEGLLGDPASRAGVVRGLALMLSSTATADAKRFALEWLGVEGTAAEVPAVAALLSDPDLGDHARRALERIPGPEAGAALLAAATALSGTPLAGVAASLGERRDPGASPALVGLMRGGDATVAAVAAGSLGRICDAAALDALMEGRSASPVVRAAIADASLECADILRVRDPRRAESIYRALWSRSGPGRVRGAALTGLAATGGAKAFPMVLKALTDGDSAVFGAALRAVRETPGPVAPEALGAAFKRLNAADQALVVEALAWRTDSAGRAVAVLAAGSRDDAVRLAGLRALGRLGDASTIQLLAKASATLTGEARDVARASLDALRGDGVDSALIAMVKPATPDTVRAELVRSLGARGNAAAVPVIEEATRDPAVPVQLEAAKALGGLAKLSSRSALIALLRETGDAGVRDAAAKSVAGIVRAASDSSAAAVPVLAALAGSSSGARAALLSILPAAGGAAALAAAHVGVGDADPEVGKAAIRALGEWPDPAPAPDLLRIAQGDADTARRVLALRGYVRLAGLPSDRSGEETAALLASALAAAPRPEDAKTVLAALAKVADPAALALAVSKLDDPAVRDEAAVAVVAIAGGLRASYPEEAAMALGRAIEAGATGKPADEAKKLLAEIGKINEFVTAWEVAGPYRAAGVDDDALLDHAFPPEDPKAAGVEWRIPARNAESESPWQVDLLHAIGGQHCVAYLRTALRVPAKAKVRLEIGSDDGVKVWLNGDVVHANNAKRPVEDGEDKVEVKLVKGWNTVLVKITQGEGGWGASLRVRTRDGKPVDGLRARSKPE